MTQWNLRMRPIMSTSFQIWRPSSVAVATRSGISKASGHGGSSFHVSFTKVGKLAAGAAWHPGPLLARPLTFYPGELLVFATFCSVSGCWIVSTVPLKVLWRYFGCFFLNLFLFCHPDYQKTTTTLCSAFSRLMYQLIAGIIEMRSLPSSRACNISNQTVNKCWN